MDDYGSVGFEYKNTTKLAQDELQIFPLLGSFQLLKHCISIQQRRQSCICLSVYWVPNEVHRRRGIELESINYYSQNQWRAGNAMTFRQQIHPHNKKHQHVLGLTYGSWKKSCTTWDVWNPKNNGINYLSTGAGVLPSTVSSSTNLMV